MSFQKDLSNFVYQEPEKSDSIWERARKGEGERIGKV